MLIVAGSRCANVSLYSNSEVLCRSASVCRKSCCAEADLFSLKERERDGFIEGGDWRKIGMA